MERKTAIASQQKANKKDMFLFVFSCAILFCTLLFVLLPALSVNNDADINVDSSNVQYPGQEVLTAVAFFSVFAVIGVIMLIGLGACWLFGFFIAVVLAFKKGDRPRWMRTSSKVLVVTYIVLILLTVLPWIF